MQQKTGIYTYSLFKVNKLSLYCDAALCIKLLLQKVLLQKTKTVINNIKH
jgi:hypothetical protein